MFDIIMEKIIMSVFVLIACEYALIRYHIKMNNDQTGNESHFREWDFFIFCLPEIILCLWSLYFNLTELTISLILGTALFLCPGVIGFYAITENIILPQKSLLKKMSVMILLSILLIFLAGDHLIFGKNAVRILSRTDGIILMELYVGYLGSRLFIKKSENNQLKQNQLSIKQASKGKSIEEKTKLKEDNILKESNISEEKKAKIRPDRNKDDKLKKHKRYILYFVFVFCMFLFGKGLIKNIVKYKKIYHESVRWFGMIPLAMVINCSWIWKYTENQTAKDIKIQLENIVNAEIMQIFLIGLAAWIHPVFISMRLFYVIIFQALSYIVLWFMIYHKRSWNRIYGCILLTIYMSFVLFFR